MLRGGERSQGGNDGMEGVFVEEADSGEEVGSRRMVAKRGRWARVGLAVVRVPRGELSEEDQDTFKRNMGPHGGDDVSSMEGDNPPVGVCVQDSAKAQCL